MTAKSLMIQGTASSVGKSVITAGLCRWFSRQGYRVAPFKAQNMSNNACVTAEGGEIGRAQAVQAQAAGVEPSVLMNPILLKPMADSRSQVVVLGKVLCEMTAAEYHRTKPKLRHTVEQAYQRLAAENDLIIIEGAGSPAEINLMENDLVNMGMAQMADAPVLLVGDIDRGGVFAALAGTMLLLPEADRSRIQGVIINKFRGDPEILKPGLRMLKQLIKVPVLGVVPYRELDLDEEDGAVELNRPTAGRGSQPAPGSRVAIRVVRLPRIANFTDFEWLARQPDVDLTYVTSPAEVAGADLVILPGSKNTIADLIWLRSRGLVEAIRAHHEGGGQIAGLCGGYQMLGTMIHNPMLSEGTTEKVAGIGLLDVFTVFGDRKITAQVEGKVLNHAAGMIAGLDGTGFQGYEIHIGRTERRRGRAPLILTRPDGEKVRDGALSDSGRVFGTYVHGIFDSPAFSRGVIDNLKRKRGEFPAPVEALDADRYRDRMLDEFARLLAENLDMNKIVRITGLHRPLGRGGIGTK
ncbi:MAG: cobyric acid synthase [Solirubrobacterales bacterium]